MTLRTRRASRRVRPPTGSGGRWSRRRVLGAGLGLAALLALPARRAAAGLVRIVRPAGPRGPALRVRPVPDGGFSIGRDLAG